MKGDWYPRSIGALGIRTLSFQPFFFGHDARWVGLELIGRIVSLGSGHGWVSGLDKTELHRVGRIW
jgi:hypothetical protein